MRLLSRLSTWLRSGREENPPEPPGSRDDAGPTSPRLPAASAECFRDNLLSAISSAREGERADVYPLDPSTHLLVIPPGYGDEEAGERRLVVDLDTAIRKMQGDGRALSSLTWSAIREANPEFEPSFLEWSSEDTGAFEGELGLIFFLDVDAIGRGMAQAAQDLGFSARVDARRPSVWVSDGRFEAHIRLHNLIVEALWTARGPLSTIRRRARALPGEFRAFLAAFTGLGRRFPDVRFDVDGGQLRARGRGVETTLHYRRLAEALRHGQIGVDRWLARASFQDLTTLPGDAELMLRAPQYRRSRPEALVADGDGHLLVAVRRNEDRLTPVEKMPDDPVERFEHYLTESHRHLRTRKVRAHAFVVREGVWAAACLVGDGVASVALHPPLVRGVVEELVPLAPTVLAEAMSEDTLILASTEAPPSLLEEARARTGALERDLYDDPADRLRYATELPIDVEPLGQFELQMVSGEYFTLRDTPALGGALGDAHAAFQRGLAFEQLGRMDRAAEAFSKSLRIDSGDGEVSFALGRCLHTLGEFERAIPLLRMAEEEFPDRAEVANALGMALYQAGDSDEAADAFERAVALDPTESAFYVNLGRSYLDEEKLDAAEKALETALHLTPDNADAHASLALVCHKAGDNIRALHHAREALAEEPENQVMKLLLRTLDHPAR